LPTIALGRIEIRRGVLLDDPRESSSLLANNEQSSHWIATSDAFGACRQRCGLRHPICLAWIPVFPRHRLRIIAHAYTKTSEASLAKLRALPVERIKVAAEHPEADVRHVVRGILRRGLKLVSKKQSIALRVDVDVLEWFKAQGPGYQSRMNAVLKAFRDASA
jgi:uncharacterized protein (DUF4415 family)